MSVSEELQPIDFETIHSQIDTKLEQVFASNEAFEEYFYATEDKTAEDLLVRLGVVLKRIENDANDRFFFMRSSTENTAVPIPEASLFEINRYYKEFPVNVLSHETAAFYKETRRPEDLKEFKLSVLNAMSNRYRVKEKDHVVHKLADLKEEVESNPNYEYPRINISPMMIKQFVESFNWEIKQHSQNPNHVLKIDTPKFSFEMELAKDDVLGDNITLKLQSDDIVVTEDLSAVYEEYFRKEILPWQLVNSIYSLQPKLIKRAFEIRNFGKSQDNDTEIIENVILKANYYPVGRTQILDVLDGILNIKAYGFDLHPSAARKLGLNVASFDDGKKYSNIGGWFRSTKELWEALFNTQFPDAIEIKPAEFTEQNHQEGDIRENATNTYQRVIETIKTEGLLNSFLATADQMREGYRLFTLEDFENFILPEGYNPIAIEKDGEYAVGYKNTEDGLDVCFQLSNQRILREEGHKLTSLLYQRKELNGKIQDMNKRLSKYGKKKEL